MLQLEELHFIKGLDPIADALAGTVRSDVINVSKAHKLFFILYTGVGLTGVSTITISACDDASPTTESAIPFVYRRMNDPDTPGAVTRATAAGFSTTAGSSDMYVIEVDMKALGNSGYKFCCLKAVESVDSPVVGCIVILMVPRYADDTSTVTS